DSHHSSRQVSPVRAAGGALPLDGADSVALRQVAWLETDRASREGAERFVSLKNQKQVKVEDEDTSSDFSAETPTKYIGEAAPALGIDAGAWKTRLKTLSERFKGEGEIYGSHVTLSAQRRTRWFTSSEGSELQFGDRAYRIMITAESQAQDGMHL